jgi:hypothetical protein
MKGECMSDWNKTRQERLAFMKGKLHQATRDELIKELASMLADSLRDCADSDFFVDLAINGHPALVNYTDAELVDEFEGYTDGNENEQDAELLKTCQFEMSLDATLNKEEEQS